MFSCRMCSKQYSKQNSLNRHMQNHIKSKHYICPLCNITFYRRDLLSRHSKMHASENQHATISFSDPSSGRQRCHTACTRCRELRTKCNGRHPCQACIRTGKDCEFSRETSRVSQGLTSGNTAQSMTESSPQSLHDDTCEPQSLPGLAQHGNDEWCPDQSDQNNDNSTDKFMHDAVLPSPESLVDPALLTDVISGQSYLQEPSTPSIYSSSQSLPPGVHSSTNELDNIFINSASDTTTWPWLHETLFLQSDWATVWPEGAFADLVFFSQFDIDGVTNGESSRATLEIQNGTQDLGVPNASAVSNPLTFPAAGYWQQHLLEQNHASLHDHRSSGHYPIPGPKQTDNISKNTPARQRILIELLITNSMQTMSQPKIADRAGYWSSMSTKVLDVFSLSSLGLESSPHILQRFVDLYLQHFSPLWPLLSHQRLDCDLIHPILYLTLTSIGAMYGGVQSAHFGTMMHNRMRESLTIELELRGVNDDLIWLAQSRLLTQVASLYFGQSKAFTYAQRLGGVLVAQARRMNLFSVPRARYNPGRRSLPRNPEERLAQWLRVEGRRRLAFGILRADMYTSMLLNTRPQISPEEIDLELPCSDHTWREPLLPIDLYLALVERDDTPGQGQRFSDIVRLAFERAEISSVLDPIGHELLLFGLQEAVWRFSHDYYLFQRIIGSNVTSSNAHSGLEGDPYLSKHTSLGKSTPIHKDPTENSFLDIMDDHLMSHSRSMCDLKSDLDRLTNALQKWKEAFKIISTVPRVGRDRYSLLSSLLLYHLSFLRLQSPIEDIHYISYRVVDKRSVEADVIGDVYNWSNSRCGYIAVRHAIAIWLLISREIQRPEATRANFNFLSFVGLHHAAAVLWAYAGAHDPENETPGSSMLTIPPLDDSEPRIPIESSTISTVLLQFSRVFDIIVPGRWSSFGAAAFKLSEFKFPSTAQTQGAD